MNNSIIIIGSENDYQIFLNQIVGEGNYRKIYECKKSSGDNTIKLCAKVINCQRDRFIEKFEKQNLQIQKSNPNNCNIVKVEIIEYLKEQNQLYIIMEKCNMNLYELSQHKQFSQNDIIDFLQQFANGYQPFYEKGITHKYLKEENILVNKMADGKLQYKIADFGVQNINKQDTWFCDSRLSDIIFAPPEKSYYYFDQVLQMNKNKCAIDMYSLGIILHYLTFKELPFKVNYNLSQFFQTIKVQPIKLPPNPTFNQEILDIIEKLLIYNPEKRLNFQELQLRLKDLHKIQNISRSLISFSPKPCFLVVKSYIHKLFITNTSFYNEQQKNMIQNFLNQQQWNQNCEWVFESFKYLPNNYFFFMPQEFEKQPALPSQSKQRDNDQFANR